MLDRAKRFVLVGAVGVGAVVLLGCEPEKDELSKALDRAQAELSAIHGSGGRAAPDELRLGVYERVVSSLKSKQSAGTDASQGVAGLVMSEAQRGIAEIAAGRAREADSRITYLLSNASTSLSVYRKQTALAESLSAYDPAADIAGYQEQIDANAAEVASLEGQIASLQQEMARKRDLVATKLAEARASRAQSSEVQARLLNAGAGERVTLAEEAATYQRAADYLEREGAIAEIEASEFEPRIEAVRREISLLRGQREALEQGIERARGAAARWGDQAKDAKREADKAGRDVRDALDEVLSVYDDEVAVQYGAALESIEAAASSAGRARGDRESKQAAEAAIGHAEASIRVEFAETAARIAGFIDEAVRSPSPSGVSSHRSRSGKLRSSGEEMLGAAGEVYKRTQQAYSGVRVQDDYTRARLEKLGEKLGAVGAALRGDEVVADDAFDDGAESEDEENADGGRGEGRR